MPNAVVNGCALKLNAEINTVQAALEKRVTQFPLGFNMALAFVEGQFVSSINWYHTNRMIYATEDDNPIVSNLVLVIGDLAADQSGPLLVGSVRGSGDGD